jgi:hypothetical protein
MKTARLLAAVLGSLGLAAAAEAQLVLDSYTGPITQNELNAFKSYMNTRTWPAHPWGDLDTDHNAISDGPAGRDVEALGLMYEATGDVAVLNRMIQFVDAFVNMRNDLAGGTHHVMWTGKVEPVWPGNGPAHAPHEYSGGENGDTIAHIEYCSLLILKTPSLWSQTVPDGNPHGYGATYLQRAKFYTARTDEANDQYSFKQFVTSANLIRNPANWPSGYHTMEANNIQMMLDGGYQRDAEIHEILGDNAARVAKYDLAVKTSVRECLDGMKHAYTAAGHTVYKWGYYPWSTSFNESTGHANYDIIGLWRAWTRRSVYGITTTEVAPFADTMLYVISKGSNQFAGIVDGSGTLQNRIDGEWLVIGDWRPAAYDLIARADVASGRYATTPHMAASILWMKQRLYGTPTPTPTATPTPTKTVTPTPRATPTPTPTATPGGFSGYYKLLARHSGKAVVVQSASTTSGADVIQWTYGGSSTNDEWQLVDLGTGYYRVVNRNSGKVLDVATASTANGGNVDQATWSGANNQQWQIAAATTGYYRLTVRHSAKVLNVSGASTTDGANVDQWSWANVNQQMFQIVSVP